MNTAVNSEVKKNVLFVDDEERILRALKALFRRDYNVYLANSGEEALRMLDQANFDVVVSDQRMPTMLGHELLSIVKRRQPQAMRLLLTGYVDKAAIINTINDGEIFRFISKPWQVEDIKNTVHEAASLAGTSFIEERPAANDANIANAERLRDLKGTMPAVLMMNPDQDVRNQIRTVSKANGFHVYSAGSIKEAIEVVKLRENIGVSIFAVDHNADEVIAALGLLREVRPEMSTIVLSDMTDSNVAISLINHSKVFRYLETPLNVTDLENSLVDGIIRHDELKTNESAQARYKADSGKLTISASLKKIFSIFGGS